MLPRRGRWSALPLMALWALGGRPDRGSAAGGERFSFPAVMFRRWGCRRHGIRSSRLCPRPGVVSSGAAGEAVEVGASRFRRDLAGCTGVRRSSSARWSRWVPAGSPAPVLNKCAPGLLLVTCVMMATGGSRSLSNRSWSSGGSGFEVVFVLWLRRRGDARSGVDVEPRSLFDGAKMEGDGGPGGCRWLVGVGSAGFLRGRPDPEQVELGARRRPMRLHWLHPSRWRWCFLRLTTLSSKEFFLLQVAAVKTTMLLSSAACCGDEDRKSVV